MKILVITDNYPGVNFNYGPEFVHSRVKEYMKTHEVMVIGFQPNLTNELHYQHESVNCTILNKYEDFKKTVVAYDADVIAIHFLNHVHMDFLLTLNKPLVVFAHGFNVMSWKRRLMNYRSPSDLIYLIDYIKSNTKQLSKMRNFIYQANLRSNIQFVFVSNWLWKAAEQDLKINVSRHQIIPNGINTERFKSTEKHQEDRKKILLLRSFRARNYANDISINAILHLSKKKFFEDLSFSLYGEGYLFKKLTETLKKFNNVSLNNYFVDNKNIPTLHSAHGIFLCPSRLDTQGVSMCEAMASGLVPITRPIGGIPEYATHGKSSFQVDDYKQISERIEYLYHNPEIFLAMSKSARLEILNKCDLSETSGKEVQLFESLVNS